MNRTATPTAPALPSPREGLPPEAGGPAGGTRPARRALRRYGPLVVGALLLGAALALWAWTVRAWPEGQWHQRDLRVYYEAARSLDHGEGQLYTAKFTAMKLYFIYPPFAALFFQVLSPLGFDHLRILVTAVSALTVLTVAWLSFGMLGHRRTLNRLALTLAVSGVAVWLHPVHWTFMWGQINLLLLLLIVADLAQPDRRWTKGVGIGLAAGLKLTPAIFIVYLLLTRRFREAGVAVVTFLGTVAVGLAAAPRASRMFWLQLEEISARVNATVGLQATNNQSLKGMAIRLTGQEGPAATVLWATLCALVVVAGMTAAALAARRGDELLGLTLCGTVGTLVSPVSWAHHWVWILPCLVLLVHTALRRRSALLWAGTGLLALYNISWPMHPLSTPDKLLPLGFIWLAPHRDARQELSWNLAQSLVGNGIVLTGLAGVLLASGWILRTALRDRNGAGWWAPPKTDGKASQGEPA